MIRLVQNNLIIPRGDTGTFSIPVLSSLEENSIGVFTILDPRTNTKIFQKQVSPSGETLTVIFSHGDTVNLPVGKYFWDIKFYLNPIFADGQLIDGVEVNSYYAAYKLPYCDIRQTGDNLLTSDDSPITTIEPETLNVLEAIANEVVTAKNEATQAAESAHTDASYIAGYVDTASEKAEAASQSAEDAAASATAASNSAEEAGSYTEIATNKAEEAETSATNAANSATAAATSATNAAQSANAALEAQQEAEDAADEATASATNAVASESAAAGSATAAAASESAAQQSATAAGNSADVASTKAQEASTSATNASNSATAAAQSATEAANSASAAAASATSASQSATVASSARTSAEVAASNATSAAQSASESASAAEEYASQITGLNATAQTLQPEQPATASYDAATGTLTIGVPKGESFHIVKTYSSVAEMNADYNNSNVKIGDFVIISSTIEDPDNAKIYVKGAQAYTFVVDMSGASGIQGVGIRNIQKTATSGLTDTYTITYSDDTTTTFNVVNGEDGDEFTVLVQNTQPTQNTNKLWIPTNQGVVQEVPTIQEMNAAIAGIQVPVQDVQVNGVSVLDAQGVANVPYADVGVLGVTQFEPEYGITRMGGTQGKAQVVRASNSQVKGGSHAYKPIVPSNQDMSTFYGFAKAAGADMANVSGATVGVYPEEQKSAIGTMLNSPVTVPGTTPSITANPEIQYFCGEVSTLDITLPSSGIVDVVFQSGSTPTVLNVIPPTGMTVEWGNDFDPTNLKANTLYEVSIEMFGTKCLGVAIGWT